MEPSSTRTHRHMRHHRGLRALRFTAFVALAVTGFGFVVERLWNWLVPPIFGLRSITFLQALGMLVLSRILFGGFHRHGGRHRGWRGQMGQRWAGMSEAEREQFRAGMRGKGRCRFDPAPASRPEQQAPESVA